MARAPGSESRSPRLLDRPGLGVAVLGKSSSQHIRVPGTQRILIHRLLVRSSHLTFDFISQFIYFVSRVGVLHSQCERERECKCVVSTAPRSR